MSKSNLKQITVRVSQADLQNLQEEAQRLQVRPGTLIRMLLHLTLTWNKNKRDSVDILGNLQQQLKTQIIEK